MPDMRFIRSRYSSASNAGHYFDAETMRYLGSRVSSVAYSARNADGTPFNPTPTYPDETSVYFFTTSEQDRSPYLSPEERAWNGERRYSVRVMTFSPKPYPDDVTSPWETEDIDTVGEFGAYASSREANAAARKAAQDYGTREAN